MPRYLSEFLWHILICFEISKFLSEINNSYTWYFRHEFITDLDNNVATLENHPINLSLKLPLSNSVGWITLHHRLISKWRGSYWSGSSTVSASIDSIINFQLGKFSMTVPYSWLCFIYWKFYDNIYTYIYIHNCSNILMITHISLITYIYTWDKGLDEGQTYINAFPKGLCLNFQLLQYFVSILYYHKSP